MSVRVNKVITINNKTIDLVSLISNPENYLGDLKSQFSESTFKQKSHETHECYLKRLFALLFYRHNRANSFNQDESFDDLCFNVVKRSEKTADITFKSSGHSFKMKTEVLKDLVNAAKAKTNSKLHLTGKCIGVELEFIGKYSEVNSFADKMRKLVGSSNFIVKSCYCHNNGYSWILGEDGSIRSRKVGMQGFEITSPILRLNSIKDMRTLEKVCDLIKTTFGAYTNNSCGTHIHMSFPVDKDDTTECSRSLKECELLCHFVKSYKASEESLFDKLVPDNRKGNTNQYCRTSSIAHIDSRYRKLNVTNYDSRSDRLHLEFRQLNGTLDFNKIILWAKIQTLFVDSALKSWDDHKRNNKPLAVNRLDLNKIVVSDIFKNSTEVESLMQMASMIS